MGVYIYPANRRAQGLTLEQQLAKVVEEVGEVAKGIACSKSEEYILDECNDAICAIEQLKRRFSEDKDLESVLRVRVKGYRRGDWDA